MYCTLADITKAIPEENILQLTDDTGTGEIDTEKINDAISYAEQLINGYLRGRYTLPLDPVPELIRHMATDLAIFHLYSRRFELEMPQGMMDKYKNALKLLEQIQKGLIRIGAEVSESPGHGYYKTNKTAGDRVFTKESLKQF